MDYRKGDRVLYNRQKFGTVHSNQFNPRQVDVVFDREKAQIVAVGVDFLELVADAHHEAALVYLINSASQPEDPDIAMIIKLANELEEGAVLDTNMLRVKANMKSVALRLRGVAANLTGKELKKQ